jgi:hypothetical protein
MDGDAGIPATERPTGVCLQNEGMRSNALLASGEAVLLD